MILFQIFLLMLLALYLVGYVITFSLLFFGSLGGDENEKFSLIQKLVISLLSWVAFAAFLVAIADGVDETNEVKK